MKPCELCKSPAKIYCDSDQASLCWTCDTKVHSANFLVARHSRTLLCRVCQSPTPWTAAGDKLAQSAVSFCEKCSAVGDDKDESEEEYNSNDEQDDDNETELDVEIEDEDDDDNNNNNNKDNQVVPLANTPPPAASSSSSDDYYSVGERGVSMKRKHVIEENVSEDDVESLSVLKSHRVSMEGNVRTLYNFMPLNAEGMGDKLSSKCEEVIDECKTTRTVGLDLNLPD